MNKPNWMKDTIAKADGYYNVKGEKLKSQKLTQEQCDAWNGVKKAVKAKAEKVVEAVEEVVEEVTEAVEETADKKAKGKKGKVTLAGIAKAAIGKGK